MNPEATVDLSSQALINWRAITAGAILAAGLSVTLIAFGAGIGLSVASTAPTWRDSSGWLWTLSGLFLIFVALCSFGFGGYVSGRVQARSPVLATVAEREFRDGLQGVVMWGLAILLTGLLALSTALFATHATSSSPGLAGGAESVAGEGLLALQLDELFRSDRATPPADIGYRRAEAGRILLKSSGHHGVPDSDRAYLAAIVAASTGIILPDAVARVDQIIGESADELHHVRTASVMQAFMVAAALVIGLAVAWLSSVEGGRERESGTLPAWTPPMVGRRRSMPG